MKIGALNKISIEFGREWKYISIARLYVNAVPKRNDVTGTSVTGLCYLQSQSRPMNVGRHIALRLQRF